MQSACCLVRRLCTRRTRWFSPPWRWFSCGISAPGSRCIRFCLFRWPASLCSTSAAGFMNALRKSRRSSLIFPRGRASMGRRNEILVAQAEIPDAGVAPDLTKTQTLRGEIEFRHLDFAYNGTPVLKDVSLKVPAGSSLAIVGPTGSGKTTLVSLLPRIYDAPPGSLLLDGRPIREYPLQVERQNIGFRPQETFLFSESLL